ncbi:putative ATP-grasp-modified RiPP [Streptomyces sp. MUSC 14]|uniref:putative ATP-grasp-modified RiPP n=1 Tax=Streptomyces sp. MUSC 14 TaxID=1354889 RepID=UPI0009A0FBE1
MADRPWGATRQGPYPTTVKMPFTAVGTDPATQLGLFRDASGRIVKMGEDRTRQGTSNPTSVMTSTYNSASTANGRFQRQRFGQRQRLQQRYGFGRVPRQLMPRSRNDRCWWPPRQLTSPQTW